MIVEITQPQPNFGQRLLESIVTGAESAYWTLTGQHWEGYERDRRRNRPVRRTVAQDTDLDVGIREDLISEARNLCQTHGICKRIIRQYANYVVGGCEVEWFTDSEEFNAAAKKGWKNWCRNAHPRHTFNSLMRIAQMSEVRDGDFFIMPNVIDTQLQLSGIEGDRIRNGESVNIDQDDIVGGCRLNAAKDVIAYQLFDRDRRGNFRNGRDIPVNRMLHLFDSERMDALRGVTGFHAALNDLRDLKEMKDTEKTGQKSRSKIAFLVKNSFGRRRPNVQMKGTDSDAAGNTIETDPVGDGAIKYMFRGDDMTAFQNNMPAESWFKLATHLVREIAVGLDLPFEFVWDMAGLPGPGVRMVSKQAERTFRVKQDNIESRLMDPICALWVVLDMDSNRLAFHPDWMKFRFTRPAHVSIDAGRDSVADLNEVKAGAKSLQIWAEERGKGNGKDILRQKAQAARWALDFAEEFDVPPSMIIDSAFSTQTNKAGDPEPEDPDEENENKETDEDDDNGESKRRDMEPRRQALLTR